MAEPTEYLRLLLGSTSYLLPNASSHYVEPRENLIINMSPDGNVVAWRAVHQARLPVYCLDASLRATRRQHWQRALFFEATPHAVGLVVDEMELMPREQATVVPFTPLGQPPTRLGHLFSGGWIMGSRVVLVFEPQAFVAYLLKQGEQQ